MWCCLCGYSWLPELSISKVLKCHSSTPKVNNWVEENFLRGFFTPYIIFTLLDTCPLSYSSKFTMTSTLLVPPVYIYDNESSRFSEKTMVLTFRSGVIPSCKTTSHWLLFSVTKLVFLKKICFSEEV